MTHHLYDFTKLKIHYAPGRRVKQKLFIYQEHVITALALADNARSLIHILAEIFVRCLADRGANDIKPSFFGTHTQPTLPTCGFWRILCENANS